MCLFTNHKEIKIATEDIYCYKKLLVIKDTNELLTPYMYVPVADGTIEIKGNGGIGVVDKLGNDLYMLTPRWIYSFVEPIEINNYHLISYKDSKHILLDAIIPKGTQYLEGWIHSPDGTKKLKSYASQKLFFQEPISYQKLFR